MHSGKTALMVADHPIKDFQDYQINGFYCRGNVIPRECIYMLPVEYLPKARRLKMKPYKDGRK